MTKCTKTANFEDHYVKIIRPKYFVSILPFSGFGSKLIKQDLFFIDAIWNKVDDFLTLKCNFHCSI